MKTTHHHKQQLCVLVSRGVLEYVCGRGGCGWVSDHSDVNVMKATHHHKQELYVLVSTGCVGVCLWEGWVCGGGCVSGHSDVNVMKAAHHHKQELCVGKYADLQLMELYISMTAPPPPNAVLTFRNFLSKKN